MILPREFGLIDRYFRPLAGLGARDLADDAAVLDIPPGRQLVVSADAMVEAVHYLPGTDPALVARKLLRVNLSDLAAMGAAPLGYLLTVAVPGDTDEAWFAAFSEGLAHDQEYYDVRLLGGDSTSTAGPTSLSLTILGTVPAGGAIGRNGARAGDGIWVTGTLGDGALGLAALRGEMNDVPGWARDWLGQRYHLPSPRLGLADGIAAAAIDISDGLLQELGHLCRGAGVVARIEGALLPFSLAVRAAGDAWQTRALRGGDDYELLLAVARGGEAALRARAEALDIDIACIGRFEAGTPAVLLDGTAVDAVGWSHFAAPKAIA